MANPYGNLAGFTDKSTPGWQRRALERVQERQKRTKRHTERKQGVLATFDIEFKALLSEAAERRGMSMQAYARRAIGAFIAYDLGVRLPQILQYTSRPNKRDPFAKRDDDDGRDHGAWIIESAREVTDAD